MKTIFIRAIEAENKGDTLLLAIQNQREANHIRFEVDPANFSSVPGSPFAYWVSEQLRITFRKFALLETEDRTARQGLATGDDFRFIRTSWEAPANYVQKTWFPFAKGGKFSPFYADIYLVINWQNKGREICNYVNDVGKLKSRPQNIDCFFRPGITWPRRTNGLSFRVMPAGCIFSDKGPTAFIKDNIPIKLLALLAVLNSQVFGSLVALQLARTELAQSFEVGVIQRTPVPNLSNLEQNDLARLALYAWSLKYELDTRVETSHAFYLPALLQTSGKNLREKAATCVGHSNEVESKLAELQVSVNNLCFHSYNIVGDEGTTGQSFSSDISNVAIEEEGDDNDAIEVDVTKLVEGLMSWLIGTVWGRWDICLSISKKTLPDLEPFAVLPICPPGMLQNNDGFPAQSVDMPTDYPIPVPWRGILVDDPSHPEDIKGRLNKVLRVIWPDCADAIEQEACEILGVESLIAYFANPSRFFDDHLKRYSKSRRAAPIYWPLSTPSGSYTLWLYYHRLTDQTLYSCVNDFVEPKLAQVSSQAAELQRRSNRSRQEEKELEQVSDLALELGAFRDELLRIARFWQPNLNDGVQITAAPLWRLFQHRAWQKRLKETWSALEAGDYDWAHLAYSIWPDRVRAKCKTDKSLAIAHDLEHLYVEPAKPVKAKKGGKSKPQAEAEQGELL